VEVDAAIIEMDATDIEGLATPIAPPVVIDMVSANGVTDGKSPQSLKQMATHGSLGTIPRYATRRYCGLGPI